MAVGVACEGNRNEIGTPTVSQHSVAFRDAQSLGSCSRDQVDYLSRTEVGVPRTQEFRLAPHIEIGIRTASVGSESESSAAIEHLSKRMWRMTEVVMSSWTIDERQVGTIGDEVEFRVVQVIAVHDEAAWHSVENAQPVQRSPADRLRVRLPQAQRSHHFNEFTLTVTKQSQLIGCLGEMHRDGSRMLDSEVD
jgi:hypothetical protein